MQRVVAGFGQPLIGGDGEEHVGRLARDLELEEIVVLEDLGVVERALDHRLRAGLAVFLQKIAFERAGVDADPHRAAVVLGRLDDLAHPLGRADIAGIDAQAGGAALGRLDRALVVEMDVGDDRHRRPARTICFSASADSWSGQETRTISAPARSSACTCSTVALTSLVTVLVIDCTVIGASPPTGTLPTWILRQARRWMSRYGRTLIVNLALLSQL